MQLWLWLWFHLPRLLRPLPLLLLRLLPLLRLLRLLHQQRLHVRRFECPTGVAVAGQREHNPAERAAVAPPGCERRCEGRRRARAGAFTKAPQPEQAPRTSACWTSGP
jgi:hypothetical protein